MPLAAWLGCAVTAGAVQYEQALQATGEPAAVALVASLAGGGIGAAPGSSHSGTQRQGWGSPGSS
ncbi:hypothetical protein C1J01_15955 [Nonomuraea aridisoli]|uniref:Uncharacterized protein n=1 Tax=Nonomuraea aridisoli TaxID=2070368 RepID=A0A2W2ENJ2_9ACTN|nr:hypothetical protein C1J01_15955 [Nonomuraea aridisoli]